MVLQNEEEQQRSHRHHLLREQRRQHHRPSASAGAEFNTYLLNKAKNDFLRLFIA
jgi:hypothetical protein